MTQKPKFELNFEMEFTVVPDPFNLSKIALIEAYQNISTCYNNQKDAIEKYKQKIYTLQQENSLKDSIQQDEMQAITDNHERELENVKKKFIIENKDLHSRLTELYSTVEKLELENEHLKNDLETLKKKSQAVLALEMNNYKGHEVLISKERMNHLERIEADHLTLIDDNASLKDEIYRITSESTQTKVIHSFYT